MLKTNRPLLVKTILDSRVFIVSAVAFAVMSFLLPMFLTWDNMHGLMTEMPTYGLAAIGLTFVLLNGELDISMGSVIALSTVLYALLSPHLGFVATLLAVIAAAAIVGLVNGVLVAYLGLDSFMITLSTMMAARGAAHLLSGSKPLPSADPVIARIADLYVGPFPAVFLFLIFCVIAAWFVLRYTKFGRNIYAIGGSKEAARAIGIPVRRYKVAVFTINAVFAALGGLAMMTRMQSGSPILGEDAALAIIAMAVIGGTAMSGGKGGAIYTLSGIVLMSLLFNIMSLFNIYVNIQQLVKGAILLGVVILDRYSANRNRKV